MAKLTKKQREILKNLEDNFQHADQEFLKATEQLKDAQRYQEATANSYLHAKAELSGAQVVLGIR